MANNDIFYNDASQVPQTFAPESIDTGQTSTDAGGTARKVRRTSIGILVGSFLDFGANTDVANSADTPTTSGLSFLRRFSNAWSQLVALVTAIGSQGDAAASSSTASASISAFIKRFSANDDQAIQAIGTTATREGALPTTLPDAFPAGASGKIGALAFVWTYTKQAAASLLSLLTSFQNNQVTGSITSTSTFVTIPTNPDGTVAVRITIGTSATIVAFGSIDAASPTYDTPLEMRSFGPSSTAFASVTTSGVYWINSAGMNSVRFAATAISGTTTIATNGTNETRGQRMLSPKSDPAFVTTTPTGIGVTTALPTLPNAYGTPIGTPPAGARGVRFEIPAGGSFTWSVQPLGQTYTSASPVGPTNAYTNNTSLLLSYSVPFDGSVNNIYLTSVNGAMSGATYRWM